MHSLTYVHYTLRLHSPAIVATRATVPHQIATRGFIPGSVIRGCMAARLLAQNHHADDALFRNLVLSQDVRYLHAYPRRNNARTMPIPLSWKCFQDNPRYGADLAYYFAEDRFENQGEDWGDIWPEERLVSLSHAFVDVSQSASRHIAVPNIDARLHQQRDRAKGRPWKDRQEHSYGAIFSCEYLEGEQEFQGVIAVTGKSAEEVEEIKRHLRADTLLLGRSRRAGYGGEGSISFLRDTHNEWPCYIADSVKTDISPNTLFRVMLTSAYVGRHPVTGQRDPVALTAELQHRFAQKALAETQCWAFELVGGFNKKWGLELPQAQAVAAGSIVILRASETLSHELLLQIEHEGLGERRNEGFGRILFLDYDQDDKVQRSLSFAFRHESEEWTEVNEPASAPLPPADLQQIHMLESALILRAVHAELDRIAIVDIVDRVRSTIPTKSLLARLRGVFRSVFDESSAEKALAKLHNWCGDSDGPRVLKERARKPLEECIIATTDLRTWLFELSGRTEDRSQALHEASGSLHHLRSIVERHYVSDQESCRSIFNEHQARLTVYLIDAVLYALGKRDENRVSRS